MNKKAILTFHYAHNYGAFLQSFSLGKEIDDSFIVNYVPYTYKNFVNKWTKKVLPLVWRIYGHIKYGIFQLFNFKELEQLNLSPKTNRIGSSVKDTYSAFIAGSDQIWNPKFISEREEIYFLDFAPPTAKRISYAASLGMKRWPKDFEQRVLPMLQKFDAISVREESSVPYLTSLGLKNVVCVCDPTILHTGDFYRREFPGAKIPKNEYAFVYKIRERIPEPVQELFADKVITVDLQKKRTIVSVPDWLGLIDHAKFVVTDSFHCAVFCLLFHKPFIVLPNNSTQQGMNERFATLLGKTGLEYRCIGKNDSSEEISEKLNAPVDWAEVESILQEWRTYSANWLKNALEN